MAASSRWSRSAAAAVALALAAGALASTSRAQAPAGHWVATWSTSLVGRPQTPPLPGPPGPAPFMASACPAPPPPATPPVTPAPGQTFAPAPFTHFANQTLRQIVHISLGGARVRVVVSNAFGNAPLTIGAAHIALRESGDAIQTAGSAPLTFSGRPTMTIPPYAVAYSDPVTLTMASGAELAIDIYLPGTTNTPSPLSMHGAAYQTNYISETGNHAGRAKFATVATTRNWFLISRVEVDAPDAGGVIVAFGDSITDGAASTADTNRRWPDLLAGRMILSSASPMRHGVVNAGIGGNRVLSDAAYGSGINALARFDTDVLGQTGVTHVIVMEGINDIGNARATPSPTAEDLIAAHKQLIERAHAKGIRIIGATLTPFWGAGYYTDVGEAKRQALNDWIRTSKLYDGVADFDKATRDLSDPKKFLAEYDSCDHLHPNDAGFRAMAGAIDLALFRSAGVRR